MRTNFALAGGGPEAVFGAAAGNTSLAGEPSTRTVAVALPEAAGADAAGARRTSW
mgnify:CR=1 FL=1